MNYISTALPSFTCFKLRKNTTTKIYELFVRDNQIYNCIQQNVGCSNNAEELLLLQKLVARMYSQSENEEPEDQINMEVDVSDEEMAKR